MAFLAPALPFIAAGTAIAGTAIAYKGSRDAARAAESQAEQRAAIEQRSAGMEAANGLVYEMTVPRDKAGKIAGRVPIKRLA
jgi:hypothetical protein